MLKLESNKKYYPLITGIIGLLSYFIVAFGIALVTKALKIDQFFLSMTVVGLIGPIIMLTLLRINEKLALRILGSAFGIFLGFMVGFTLGYVVAAIAPGGENSPIVNVVALIVMNIIYTVIMGVLLYGKGSPIFFLISSAIIGLILGIIMVFIGAFKVAGVDISYLYILTSFGINLGLSLGLYRYMKKI